MAIEVPQNEEISGGDRNQNTVLGFPGKSYIRFICLFVSKCLQFYFYSGHTDRQTLSFIYRVSQKNVLTLRMTRKPLFMNMESNEIASNT